MIQPCNNHSKIVQIHHLGGAEVGGQRRLRLPWLCAQSYEMRISLFALRSISVCSFVNFDTKNLSSLGIRDLMSYVSIACFLCKDVKNGLYLYSIFKYGFAFYVFFVFVPFQAALTF